jgi:DNA polymerase III delta subunit
MLPFLVSYGSEDLLLDRDIERVKAWPDRSIVVVDAEGMLDVAVVSVCEMRSFEPRTVILDNAHKIKGDKLLREYIANRSATDLSVIVAAIIRSEKLPEVWSLVGDRGKVYHHKTFKSWGRGEDYIQWITAEITKLHKVTAADGIPQILYQFVGPDLYRLANEIRKLALLVGPGGTITKEHIALVISPTPQATQFNVADAAIAKDAKGAMNALSMLMRSAGEGILIPVVAALMSKVEKTLIIRRMLDKGRSKEEMALAVGMKPWPFEEFALPAARKHDLKGLVRHMGQLCKLDADVKGPARSKRTLVELAVLSIAR